MTPPEQPADPTDASASGLPPGVARLLLLDGMAHAEVSPVLLAAGPAGALALAVGRARSPFERMAPDAAAALGLRLATRFEVDPARLEAALGPDPAAEIRLNPSLQWTEAGADTLQIRLRRRHGRATIPVAAPLRLPAHQGALTLRLGLATHRAGAHLVARLSALPGPEGPGRLLRTTEVPFDPDFGGGPSVRGYRQVAWTIPPADEATELRLAVAYDRPLAPEDVHDPYLFVSDPRVLPSGAAAAEAPAGLILAGPRPPGPLAWASAPLPAPLTPGEALWLLSPAGRARLLLGRDAKVRLDEDRGFGLLLRAAEPLDVHLALDGETALVARLGPEPTLVRLPPRLLTGQRRRLDVRDPAGAQTFLSTWVLTPRALTPVEVAQVEGSAPFPGPLAPQAAHRYRGLQAALAERISPADQALLTTALGALEAGPGRVELRPLAFPQVADPDVSIVMPAHDQVAMTYLSLCSLILARCRASFEVILVDDASTDATARIEEVVTGIEVVRHAEPQRFVRACNAGAARARGRHLVLLNNDVEVTAGWLDALLDAFARFDRVGLAGARLLFPDGRLQDAGGIVWRSGVPMNYGRGDNPWDPRFAYARQADYLSGAALMASREAWEAVGGLSAGFEPMYFEDADLAFKVRAAGYSTWYVPSAVVYHAEGATSGTDLGAGHKRFQAINLPRFKRRWAQAFVAHGPDGGDPDLEKDRGQRGRVLFIDHAVPRPDRDAGSHAVAQEMRLVQRMGWKVTFLPQNMAHLGGYVEALQRQGIEVVHAPFALTAQEFLAARGPEFDAVHLTRWHVAADLMDAIELHAPDARVLLNDCDLHFLREMRAARVQGDPEAMARARELREAELAALRRADVVLSYNEVEHAVIESHTDGEVRVMRAPWVVDLPGDVPGPEGREGLAFLGNYGHRPNVEAVEWFVRAVLPRLRGQGQGRGADLRLHVYGAAMPKAWAALSAEGVVAEGFAPDLGPALARHRVFAAPLLSGAGLKGKVFAALAHGIPSVLTPVAAEGTGLRHGLEALIAATPEEWVAAVTALTTDDALWRRLSEAGGRYVRENHSAEAGLALMRRAFEAADLYA